MDNEKIENFEYVQLELFPKSETEQLREEFSKLKKQTENVRKGIFSRYNEVLKMHLQLVDEVNLLRKTVEEMKGEAAENIQNIS